MRRGVSGALCPDCEGRHTRTLATGYTDQGHRLRRRRCIDCGAPSFVTVEIVVPATWGELDTNHRLKQRDYFRRKQGFQGRYEMARNQVKPATLDVKVSVKRRAA